MSKGEFIIHGGTDKEVVVPNTIVAEGAERMLELLFQNTAIGSLFLGLCNQAADNSDILAGVTTEPTIGVNGYARIQLSRNTVDFPTIETVNNQTFVTSKLATFIASGGAFDKAVNRMFLCDAASGAGKLFAYSGAMTTPVTVGDLDQLPVQYRFYLS